MYITVAFLQYNDYCSRTVGRDNGLFPYPWFASQGSHITYTRTPLSTMAIFFFPSLVLWLIPRFSLLFHLQQKAIQYIASHHSQATNRKRMRMRMKMQKCAALALMLTATSVVSFAPTTSTRVLPATSSTLILHTTAKEQQFTHLEEMAHKFRLRVFDVDTGMSYRRYSMRAKCRCRCQNNIPCHKH